MEKDGIQSAIDFTKYLVTLAGGAIAFVIKPDYASAGYFKFLSIAALVLLSASVVSGILVFATGCNMLARKNYNLNDKYIRRYGRTNVLTFAAGFLVLAAEVGVKVIKGIN